MNIEQAIDIAKWDKKSTWVEVVRKWSKRINRRTWMIERGVK